MIIILNNNGIKTVLNFAQVSKIELLEDGYLYFYGMPFASHNGGGYMPVLAAPKYKSGEVAESVFGKIIDDCRLSKRFSYHIDADLDTD